MLLQDVSGQEETAEPQQDRQQLWARLREVGGHAVAVVEASREELETKEKLAAASAAREATAGEMLNEARATLFAARFQRKHARRLAQAQALQVAECYVQQHKRARSQARRSAPAKVVETVATLTPPLSASAVLLLAEADLEGAVAIEGSARSPTHIT